MVKKWIFLSILGVALALPSGVGSLDLAAGFKVSAGYPGFMGSDFRSYLDTNDGRRQYIATTSVGGYMVLGIFDFLAIQPEVLYTMTGAAFRVNSTDQSIQLNYLELPLLVKLRLGRFALSFGPDLFIRLNHGRFSQEGAVPAEGEFDASDLRALVLAGAAGLEMDLALGNATLTLGGRYVLGFQPPNESSAAAPVLGENEFKLSHILLTVGVSYGSGR